MKFFGWMQNKLSVKQVNRPSTSTSSHDVTREEFSDWPQGLLAIGTFGNNGLKENAEIEEIQDEASEAQEEVLEDSFTPEELGKLQKELTKLLSKSKKRKSDVHKELANLPLDRFLNCPSSLEVDRRISNAICNVDSNDHEEDIERTISVLLGRCKEISSIEKKRRGIGKKSVSFLLKKMFVCADGFAPWPPSLRDTLQESRMEKLLRMMLHKKINQQSSSSSRGSSMKKKYLEDRQTQNQNAIDDNNEEEKVSEGKWVKTDSDFIVLEI